MTTALMEKPAPSAIESRDEFRKKIFCLEETMAKIPGATFGDSPEMPLKHSFAEGVYVREIFIPKGHILTGKIHKHSHPNFLMSGEVIVVTEERGREHLKAPLSMISAPGTKRAVIALEDTTWITVHVTNETDLEKIEDYVIAKTYDDPVLLAYDVSQKNCLILALKEKGRDYKSLMGIVPQGHLLPFKQSLEKLKESGVSIDGLFVEKTGDNEWHVSTREGTPLADVSPEENDMVGTWGGVAIGAGAIGSAVIGNMGKKKQSQVPLETPEQAAARRKLMGFADTGKFGDFTAGAEVPLGYGDYGITGYEQQGLSNLQQLLSQDIPEQYRLGDDALQAYLATDPTDVSAQFDPFKQQTERQIADSNRALKRNAGFAGGLYSTNTIRQLGDIQARGNETLTSELARLTDSALNRRLQAIPLAYQSAEAKRNAAIQNVAASQQYGSLTRKLNDAAIKARDAELLRRRQELQLPIQAAQSVAGQSSQFGVPSVTTSPYQDLMKMIGQVGGSYLSNKLFSGGGGGGGGGGGWDDYSDLWEV
ncbi:MAG: hypothetical protein IPO76_05990 [Elusimicrobia bacterium]|nr:hypothetical protein [Elusimicrobiota bacterium]